MKKILVKLFFVLSVMCVISCTEKKNNTDFLYHFEQTENSGVNIPIVEIPVNNEGKYFIIDTGANMSLIDEEYYEKNEDDFQYIKTIDMTIQGISGGKDVTSAYIMAELGDSIKIKHQFMTSNLKGVISNIKNSCGREIIGLIGADYLIRYDFSVDFKNRAIYRNVIPLDSIINKQLVLK